MSINKDTKIITCALICNGANKFCQDGGAMPH